MGTNRYPNAPFEQLWRREGEEQNIIALLGHGSKGGA